MPPTQKRGGSFRRKQSVIDRRRAPSMKDFYASLDVSSVQQEAISPPRSLLSPS